MEKVQLEVIKLCHWKKTKNDEKTRACLGDFIANPPDQLPRNNLLEKRKEEEREINRLTDK